MFYLILAVGAGLVIFALVGTYLEDGERHSVEPQGKATLKPEKKKNKFSKLENVETTDFALALLIDIARVKPDGAAVFAGSGKPDSVIRIFEKDVLLGETKADSNGEWVIILDNLLAPGQHLISVAMLSESGNKILAQR